jgi:hypothetical protein
MGRDTLKAKHDELTERIQALQEQMLPVREQLSNMDKQLSVLLGERLLIEFDLKEAAKAPRVSDHAVIRYLERRYDFDFEHVRKELLTPTVIEAMEAGIESVKIHHGTLKIKGKTVVTYV